jgi:lysophospholipase L1-like esterase
MAHRTVIQADSPLFYWPMDEDASATSLVATVGSTAITLGLTTAKPTAGITGKVDGTCVQFDGTTDTAASASTLDLTAETKIYVEFLLWWDSYAANDDFALEFTANGGSTSGGFFIDPNAVSPAVTMSLAARGNTGLQLAGYTRPPRACWHHVVAVIDFTLATNEIDLYIDGELLTASSRPNNTNNSGALANSTLYLFCRNNVSNFGAGRMQHLAIFDNLDATKIRNHYLSAFPAGYRYAYVCDGDSITAGLNLAAGLDFPTLAAFTLNTGKIYNFGVSGQRVDQMNADAAAQIDVLYAGTSTHTKRIAFLHGGINDCAAGDSAATLQGEIQTWWEARRAAGWLVGASTILPASSVVGANETTRVAVNTWISANWSTYCDFFVDFNASSGSISLQGDGVHPDAAGQAVMAGLLATGIQSLIIPTGLSATAVSGTRIDLTWDQYAASAEVDQFITLEYGTAADFTGATAVDAISLELTSTSVTGLTPETLYYFRIKLNPDLDPDSGWSNTASATTSAASTGNNQTNRMSIGISTGM